MKKLTYLLFLAIGVTACSVESMDSTENLLTADLSATSTDYSVTFKSSVCEGDFPVFVVSHPQLTSKQGGVTTNVSTEVEFRLKVEGKWEAFAKFNSPGTGSEYTSTVAFPKGTYLFDYKIEKQNIEDRPEFSLEVGDCCKDALTVDFKCGDTKTATLTFTAEEAGAIVIQGGLSNGTTIVKATSNVLTRNTTHSSVVNSNSNVTRWEGTVDACQVVTVTIEYSGGNGIGDWSATRGNDELGSTEKQTCPIE